MTDKNFDFRKNEDVKDFIKEWNEERRPFMQEQINYISTNLEMLKNSDVLTDIPELDFTYAYQVLDIHTNKVPKLLSFLKPVLETPEYTVTKETYNDLCVLCEEAKTIKNKLKNLRKEWKYEKLEYYLRTGQFAIGYADLGGYTKGDS